MCLITKKYFLRITLFFLAVNILLIAGDLQIYTEEWKPISFSEQDSLQGLGVEVVQEIMKLQNIHGEINIVPWARGWQIINTRPNTILFTMTITPDRVKKFKLIGPVAIGKTNFYCKKGSGIKINSLAAAKKVPRIGVYKSAVEEQYLTQHGFKNLEATSLPLHSAKKLMHGRISIWCNADLTAPAILAKAGYSIDDVEKVYTLRQNHLYIAFSAATPDSIVKEWKKSLQAIKEDGTFTKIYNKWLPDKKPPLYTKMINRISHQSSTKIPETKFK